MSKFKLLTETRDRVPIEVLCGWDNPLNGYFLLVERLGLPSVAEGHDEDNYYLFDNLALSNPHPDNLTPFLDTLSELGIELPETMRRQIAASARHDGDAFQEAIYFDASGREITAEEYQKRKRCYVQCA